MSTKAEVVFLFSASHRMLCRKVPASVGLFIIFWEHLLPISVK